MKNPKYHIGLDVHKERTTYVVRDQRGNILLEGKTATLQEPFFPYTIEAYFLSYPLLLHSMRNIMAIHTTAMITKGKTVSCKLSVETSAPYCS